MIEADRVLSTPPKNTSAVSTRRSFLSQTAGIAAGGAALALGTVSPQPSAAP
jgi:hypothetical protein